MKKSKIVLIIIIGVIAVLFLINFQAKNKDKPIEEIFSENEDQPVDIEYEFIEKQEPVKTETVKADDHISDMKEKPTIEHGKVFAIQVASFKDESKAQELLKTLKDNNYSAYIKKREIESKGTWFRIYVGDYSTKSSAIDMLTKIKPLYKNSFIIEIR